MVRGNRVNILVVYDQSERSYQWSISVAVLRLLLGGAIVVAVLAAVAVVLIPRAATQHRRFAELTADNRRLSTYVLEVDQLRGELAQHREFTRRLCELIDVPFPDSASMWTGTTASTIKLEGRGLGLLGQGELPLDSARLPAELSVDPENRPQGIPMRGEPSRGFAPDLESPSLRHYGLDIAGREGLPVYATAAGVVEFAGWDEAMGYTIIIDHGSSYKTVYGHNSVLMCEAGQTISFGELISLSGNSGRSSAPHLHYEIRFHNRPVDPLGFVFADMTMVSPKDESSH